MRRVGGHSVPPMFRTTLILTSAAAIALAVSACGLRIENDGPHTVQTRTVGTFHRVDLRGSANVVVTRGRPRTLTVSGGRNRVRDVVTRVQSGTLVVEDRNSDATLHLGGDGPTVTVSTPSLVGARLDGSGDLSMAGLAGGPLQIRVDGSGDVDAHGRLDASTPPSTARATSTWATSWPSRPRSISPGAATPTSTPCALWRPWSAAAGTSTTPATRR